MEMLTDRQMAKKGQTNIWKYTNFKSNLAMMVIYLPVKFEFDWTKRFRVKSPKTEKLTDRQTDVGHINLMAGWLHATRLKTVKYMFLAKTLPTT